MKKYKYTQLLEISLELALAEIARLKDTKLHLIPDVDPELEKRLEGWGISKKTGHVLSELETTPDSVTATFIKEEDSHPSDVFWIKRKETKRKEPCVSYTQACESEAANFHKKPQYMTSFRKNNPDLCAHIAKNAKEVESWDESKQEAIVVMGHLPEVPTYLNRVKKHRPEIVAWYTKLLEGYPSTFQMIEDLKRRLNLNRNEFAQLVGVGKDTIINWRSNPEQYHNPYKLENLVKLYDEHFPKKGWFVETAEKNRQELNKRTKEQRESAQTELQLKRELEVDSYFAKGQQSVLSETSVGCIKAEEEIITEKPTPPLSVAPPKALQRVPRLLQHTDSIELLQLPQRALNALQAVSVRTIGDLVQWTEEGLKNVKGLGDKSFKEVVNKTLKAGFRFTRLGK